MEDNDIDFDTYYNDEMEFGYILSEPDRWGRYREEKNEESLDRDRR